MTRTLTQGIIGMMLLVLMTAHADARGARGWGTPHTMRGPMYHKGYRAPPRETIAERHPLRFRGYGGYGGYVGYGGYGGYTGYGGYYGFGGDVVSEQFHERYWRRHFESSTVTVQAPPRHHYVSRPHGCGCSCQCNCCSSCSELTAAPTPQWWDDPAMAESGGLNQNVGYIPPGINLIRQ